ncbi:MAG: hypothetical protein GTO17_08280, partial [Candidatus Aminicenantes bacterium]|nr:hypothetical protein [Candidatus Aminicenantes bacterium]
GKGFKKKPKLIRVAGRWYPVDQEMWKFVQKLELREVRRKKKKVM